MRSPNAHSDRGADRISMTPMIDVVFLLIIFFLVSSHLARRENRYPVQLTAAGSAQLRQLEERFITLAIDREGALFYQALPLHVEALNEDWRASIAQANQDGRTQSQRVRLRIDERVPYESVEPVLRQLSKLGMSDVSLAVLNSSEKAR